MQVPFFLGHPVYKKETGGEAISDTSVYLLAFARNFPNHKFNSERSIRTLTTNNNSKE